MSIGVPFSVYNVSKGYPFDVRFDMRLGHHLIAKRRLSGAVSSCKPEARSALLLLVLAQSPFLQYEDHAGSLA